MSEFEDYAFTEENESTLTIRVYPRQQFNKDDFKLDFDQFKDVIILPKEAFTFLFDDKVSSGYVRVSTLDSNEQLTLYALPFNESYEPDGEPYAYLRNHVKQQLSISSESPRIQISPVPIVDSGPLKIVRLSTRLESTEPNTCRLHPETLASLDLTDRDQVELYNPDTGFRFQATAIAEPLIERDQCSLGARARKLLEAEFSERASDEETEVLHARQPVTCHEDHRARFSRVRKAIRWILDWAVNYHETHLRIVIGLNADEGRATGRVNADTMETLAVENNDRVRIKSKETETSVRVRQIAPNSHLIETDEHIDQTDVHGRTILLPSTVREEIDAVCGDSVSVRRDTKHIAIRQITPSLFAFLGVFIGGVQTVSLIIPAQFQLYGLALTFVLSVIAIWLLLWPERERCR